VRPPDRGWRKTAGADVADSNLLLALVTLAIKTYQASTSFSRQLLVSAISGSVDAEQMVRDDLALVHALALDSAGIQGTGAANQPRGVLNTAGIGAEVGGANGAAATYANMVNMETTVAVANADVETMAYLTNPQQRGKLKQIAQLANTANIPVWHDGEVNGYRAEVSTQVPSNLTKGTSVGICSAIIFGDWSQLIYGEWGILELITDPFRLKKQGMIEVTSFQMADVGVRIPRRSPPCRTRSNRRVAPDVTGSWAVIASLPSSPCRTTPTQKSPGGEMAVETFDSKRSDQGHEDDRDHRARGRELRRSLRGQGSSALNGPHKVPTWFALELIGGNRAVEYDADNPT
jgi:hypothetical protein